MSKDSKRRATRRAKQKRIEEARVMLSMGIEGEWKNEGKHANAWETLSGGKSVPLFTCLCKQCVIDLAYKKLGMWLK